MVAADPRSRLAPCHGGAIRTNEIARKSIRVLEKSRGHEAVRYVMLVWWCASHREVQRRAVRYCRQERVPNKPACRYLRLLLQVPSRGLF